MQFHHYPNLTSPLQTNNATYPPLAERSTSLQALSPTIQLQPIALPAWFHAAPTLTPAATPYSLATHSWGMQPAAWGAVASGVSLLPQPRGTMAHIIWSPSQPTAAIPIQMYAQAQHPTHTFTGPLQPHTEQNFVSNMEIDGTSQPSTPSLKRTAEFSDGDIEKNEGSKRPKTNSAQVKDGPPQTSLPNLNWSSMGQHLTVTILNLAKSTEGLHELDTKVPAFLDLLNQTGVPLADQYVAQFVYSYSATVCKVYTKECAGRRRCDQLLASVLKHTSMLNLTSQKLTPQQLAMLTRALKGNTSVNVLHLSVNAFKFLDKLCCYIKQTTVLSELKIIGDIDPPDECMKLILFAIQANRSLQKVDLTQFRDKPEDANTQLFLGFGIPGITIQQARELVAQEVQTNIRLQRFPGASPLSPGLSPASGREGRNESLRDFHVDESGQAFQPRMKGWTKTYHDALLLSKLTKDEIEAVKNCVEYGILPEGHHFMVLVNCLRYPEKYGVKFPGNENVQLLEDIIHSTPSLSFSRGWDKYNNSGQTGDTAIQQYVTDTLTICPRITKIKLILSNKDNNLTFLNLARSVFTALQKPSNVVSLEFGCVDMLRIVDSVDDLLACIKYNHFKSLHFKRVFLPHDRYLELLSILENQSCLESLGLGIDALFAPNIDRVSLGEATVLSTKKIVDQNKLVSLSFPSLLIGQPERTIKLLHIVKMHDSINTIFIAVPDEAVQLKEAIIELIKNDKKLATVCLYLTESSYQAMSNDVRAALIHNFTLNSLVFKIGLKSPLKLLEPSRILERNRFLQTYRPDTLNCPFFAAALPLFQCLPYLPTELVVLLIQNMACVLEQNPQTKLTGVGTLIKLAQSIGFNGFNNKRFPSSTISLPAPHTAPSQSLPGTVEDQLQLDPTAPH